MGLDNFDVTGRWRIRENGNPVELGLSFMTGRRLRTLSQISDALLKRPCLS
ncbi:MAG: hypothetical protein Ct9H300mP15_11880 [Gemmatimonadota bacterium]|nr:MAG: hypothetical protein Ct9H300mP15_11880 [Gemmatimonadota bacterium]